MIDLLRALGAFAAWPARDISAGLRRPPRWPWLRRLALAAALVFIAWFVWSDVQGWGDLQ